MPKPAVSSCVRENPGRHAAVRPGRVSGEVRPHRRRVRDGLVDQRQRPQEARGDPGFQAGALPVRPLRPLAVGRPGYRDSVRDLQPRDLPGLRGVARHPLPPRAGDAGQQARRLRQGRRTLPGSRGRRDGARPLHADPVARASAPTIRAGSSTSTTAFCPVSWAPSLTTTRPTPAA